MDFALSTAQERLHAPARALAETHMAPRAAEIDRTEAYPWDNVERLRAAGLLGMTIAKELGGAGLGYFEAVLVIEEMAKHCGAAARILVETNMGAIGAILKYGTPAQRKLAADLVLSGDKPAICITEPGAGSAATEMTTRADKRGDVYVLNGKKHWITGGGVSRLHLVFARVFDERGAEQGIGGFILVGPPPPNTPQGADHRQARAGAGVTRHSGDRADLRQSRSPGRHVAQAATRAAPRLRRADGCLQRTACRCGDGRARSCPRRLREGADLRQQA